MIKISTSLGCVTTSVYQFTCVHKVHNEILNFTENMSGEQFTTRVNSMQSKRLGTRSTFI